MSSTMYRQFFWGLSNGIVVLAVAGGFFFGAGAVSLRTGWLQMAGIAVTVICVASLLAGSRRIRKKADGFRMADLKTGSPEQRALARKLGVFFRWIILAEWTAFGSVSFLCHHFGADELTAPLIGLVISLHFAPLARLFRLPAYYATALLGSAFAILSIALPAARLPVLGFGLGATMWSTATDSILRATTLAANWHDGPATAQGVQ